MSLPLPLGLLETVANRVIRLDPFSQRKLAELDGRLIAIHSEQPDFDFYLQPTDSGLRFLKQPEGEPDVTLRGDMSGFIKLLKSDGAGFSDAGVRIEGDVEIAQKLKAVMEHLDPDWEEELSHFVGDVAAHQIGRTARGMKDWLTSVHRTVEQNTAEYFQEEAKLLAKHEQVERFITDVDHLRDDVERLAARIEQLKDV